MNFARTYCIYCMYITLLHVLWHVTLDISWPLCSWSRAHSFVVVIGWGIVLYHDGTCASFLDHRTASYIGFLRHR
jgi:hypothetical protein